MRTLYYVFDTQKAKAIVEREYVITTINASLTEDVEDAIDMSLLDFLNEPVKIVFMAKDSKLEAFVKTLAKKYDVEYSDFLESDIIDWKHKVIMKEEYYDL